jgi:hypothetical protein
LAMPISRGPFPKRPSYFCGTIPPASDTDQIGEKTRQRQSLSHFGS